MSKNKLSVTANRSGGKLVWEDKSYELEANKEFNMNI